MKKLSILAVLLSAMFCYLEWGADQRAFLFEMEYLLFFRGKGSTDTFTHPFVLLPLAGQLLLLWALSSPHPSKKLTFTALGMLSVLPLMIFLVGILARNIKIAGSVMPFLAAGWWCIRTFKPASDS